MCRAIGAILLGFALLFAMFGFETPNPDGSKSSWPSPGQKVLTRTVGHLGTVDNNTASPATPQSPQTRAPDNQILQQPVQGMAALTQIGDRLAEVAQANGMSPEALSKVLLTDESAWLGRSGHLYYAEEVKPAGVGGTLPTPSAATTSPLEDTFSLHSLPGSNRTIFLDFDGHGLASNNSWVDYQYLPTRSYSGFTLDADPAAFNNTELAYVQTVWRIVAEKYAAFDVDVTTEDVGTGSWDRTSYGDQQYGVRVVITNDPVASQNACNNLCSGIAWIGQFDALASATDYWQPAWVFSNMTYGSATLTANTAAHEIGHTLGLEHDGTSSQSYYGGHSNWSPIMGGGVNAVQQFSKGEYSGANNAEDDLSRIGTNGALPRADDHPDVLASTLPDEAAASMNHSGVITSAADVDVFAVTTTCPTSFSAGASGVGEGSMLDISLEILGPSGELLNSADPVSGQNSSYWPAIPTGLDATATANGTVAGDYYIRVRGVGKGNPLNTGYSNYSSIGSYELEVQTSCLDGGGVDDPPGEDPPGEDPPGEDPPGEDPPQESTPRHDFPSARVPLVSRVRATAGHRGGSKTVRLAWTTDSDAIQYRVEVSREGKASRVLRVISTTNNRIELRLRTGRYKVRAKAIGVNGTSAWSSWSAPVRSR